MFSFVLREKYNFKTSAKENDILLSVVTSTLHQYTWTFLLNNPTRQYALGIFRLKADSTATDALPVCHEMKLICCSSVHSRTHHFPSMQTMKVPVHKIPHYYTLCVAELANLSLLEWKKGCSFVTFCADDAGAGRPVTFFVMSPI